MIKNLFLDLDDTIFDFKAAEKLALGKTLNALGIPPEEETLALYSRINAGHWKMLERGEITRAELRHRRFAGLFAALGVSADPELAAERYEKNLAVGHIFIPGAPELLEALHGRYRLYLASNGFAATQHGRLSGSGIEPLFEDIFISQEIGADKPEAEFFERCFARIPGFSREETAIIGDSLSSDIRGGKNAGITTVWYNPHGKTAPGDCLPDAEIRALSELPALLETL